MIDRLSGRGRRRGMIFAASMVAALLAVAGCTERRDRSNLLTSIPTEEITFSMKKTVTGDLAITVPKSYVYDYGGGDQRDNFFFTDPADTSSVQRGMIYLSIGPTPVTFIPDSIEVMKTGGRIAGEDLEWREAIDTVEGGVRLFQKEAIARTLLKSYPSPGTKEGYILQAMVVGSDEVLVERLMAAVESIHPVKKGNL